MVLHTWRNIFFFEDLFTILVGFIALFLMPRSPKECNFLSDRERTIARMRLLSDDRVEEGDRAEEDAKITVTHVTSAAKDVSNYFCAVGFFFVNITVQGISLFLVRHHDT
jgi:adenylosuccinate synthase